MYLQVGKKLNVNIIKVTAKLHQMKRLKQLHQKIVSSLEKLCVSRICHNEITMRELTNYKAGF